LQRYPRTFAVRIAWSTSLPGPHHAAGVLHQYHYSELRQSVASAGLLSSILAAGAVMKTLTIKNRSSNAMNRSAIFKQGGFTVIELAIVVTIVAILAIIAIPTYQSSVRQGRRGDAKGDLVQLAQFLERCYTNSSTYLACTQVSPANVVIVPYNTSPQNAALTNQTINYNITFSAGPTRTTYTLTAAPVVGSDQAKDPCGALSLDNTGTKTSVGTNGGAGTTCW